MKVSIVFFGAHRAIAKTDSIYMPIAENTTVNDALEYVKRRYPALHLDKGMVLATVNKEITSVDRILKADDTVSFVPHIGGG
jgi:molybdopterin converting factor small subunit